MEEKEKKEMTEDKKEISEDNEKISEDKKEIKTEKFEKEIKSEKIETSESAGSADRSSLVSQSSLDEKDILKTFKSIDIKRVKEYFNRFSDFFQNKNNSGKVILFIAILTLVSAVYLSAGLVSKIKLLNSQTLQLRKLNNYDVSILNNGKAKEILNFSTNISDLIQKNNETKQSIVRYDKYLQDLYIPYQNFLQYIYLPRLNIWKDAYTNQIDISLIGENFLKKNPYNDLVLLQKWSDFFKSVGNANEFNEVSDISIGSINETPDGYFYIPMTVSFVANSKRSFLMLVDKLSNTSNKANIGLINEFFYYLRQEIKKQKNNEIQGLINKYSKDLGSDVSQDVFIGYSLYNWIYKNGENVLVDAKIIEDAIRGLMICGEGDINQCYYQFRDKYREISTFAYAVSKDITIDTVTGFKDFFASLPSLLLIKDFTFDKIKSTELGSFENMKYQGKVIINVYGQGVAQEDVDQIAGVLGKQCLGKEQMISIGEALNMVQDAILKQSDIAGADKSKIDDLRELKGILENVSAEYPNLSNYKKIIRLFEIYRMLVDSSLCQ